MTFHWNSFKKIKEARFSKESTYSYFLLRHKCNWKYNNTAIVESNSDCANESDFRKSEMTLVL